MTRIFLILGVFALFSAGACDELSDTGFFHSNLDDELSSNGTNGTTVEVHTTLAQLTTESQESSTTGSPEQPTTSHKVQTTEATEETTTHDEPTTQGHEDTTTLAPVTLIPTNTTSAHHKTTEIATTSAAETTTQGLTTTTPVPGFCEGDDWLYNNGHCYWSSVLSGVSGGGASANWYKALVTCSSLKSNLISVHTQAQNEAVWPLTCAQSVWLGLAATGNITAPVKGWDWTDLTKNDFEHWASEYPADRFGCSYQSTNKTDWFNDRDCQRSNMPFVCAKPAETRFGTTTRHAVQEDENQKCDLGWTHHRGSCYLVSDNAVDYFAAELSCRIQGAKIASIHQEGESGFILIGLGATCEDLWIGLVNVNPSRMTEKASWQWDDQEQFNLDNWPNHAVPYDDEKKLCTAISTAGYWYNKPCWTPNRYVCKKPPTH